MNCCKACLVSWVIKPDRQNNDYSDDIFLPHVEISVHGSYRQIRFPALCPQSTHVLLLFAGFKLMVWLSLPTLGRKWFNTNQTEVKYSQTTSSHWGIKIKNAALQVIQSLVVSLSWNEWPVIILSHWAQYPSVSPVFILHHSENEWRIMCKWDGNE